MKNSITIKRLFFLLFTLFSTSIFAQKGTVSAGGDASNSTHFASYSIGQAFYQTGAISEGLQQPHRTVIIGLDEFHSTKVKVYPNPTADRLNIQAPNGEKRRYSFVSINGKILEESEFNSTAKIHTNNYSKGIYFLRIIHSKNKIETFKIIKK